MNQSPLTVHIPIEDWQAEALRTETPITSRDDVIAAVEAGFHTAQIARMAVVWREMGMAPADMMRPNKLLLHSGAREDVSRMIRQGRHSVKVNGKTYNAPDYVGPVRTPESEPEPVDDDTVIMQTTLPAPDPDLPKTYVKHSDPQAATIAERYLLDVVPGHIWPRLLTIHEAGGDPAQIVEELKKLLDEMVGKLK